MRNDELTHYGVKGMKWGIRRRVNKVSKSIRKTASKISEKTKEKTKNFANSELSKRGKSAVDVLLNGDTDWMGNHIYSDSIKTEVVNRGRAAVERLLYSPEQIDSKKFFGRYDF